MIAQNSVSSSKQGISVFSNNDFDIGHNDHICKPKQCLNTGYVYTKVGDINHFQIIAQTILVLVTVTLTLTYVNPIIIQSEHSLPLQWLCRQGVDGRSDE
jgi:hypothetical protein